MRNNDDMFDREKQSESMADKEYQNSNPNNPNDFIRRESSGNMNQDFQNTNANRNQISKTRYNFWHHAYYPIRIIIGIFVVLCFLALTIFTDGAFDMEALFLFWFVPWRRIGRMATNDYDRSGPGSYSNNTNNRYRSRKGPFED